jgi:hypothetical protein
MRDVARDESEDESDTRQDDDAPDTRDDLRQAEFAVAQRLGHRHSNGSVAALI